MSEVSQRERMVEHQLRARGIHDESVLAAMRKVPRHAFVPEESAPLPTRIALFRWGRAKQSRNHSSSPG